MTKEDRCCMLLDKRQKAMFQATNAEEFTMQHENNLLQDVPHEVVKCYAQHLDLKSLVMFHCACKRSYDVEFVRLREEQSLERMLNGIIGVCKDILNVVSTHEGQNRLLASILRKLIFVSVSDVSQHGNNAIASTQTLSEYNTILEYITNEMDLSIYAFNELLEDAQFEFRGFNIININRERRDNLDKVKQIIREWYFSKPFTVHTYCTFGTTCVELDCNRDVAMFDVHRHLDEENQDMMFLMDTINEFRQHHDVERGDLKLLRDLDKNVKLVQYMYHWDINNTQSTKAMSKVMKRLIDCHPFYRGSSEICLEVWNDLLDDNWVLANVIDDMLTNGMYGFILKDITDECQRVYRDHLYQMEL